MARQWTTVGRKRVLKGAKSGKRYVVNAVSGSLTKGMRRSRIRNGYNTYSYKNFYYKSSAFQVVPGTDTFGAIQFALQGMITAAQLAAFQGLYDSYSIRKVVVKLLPKFNSIDTNSNSLVPIFSVIDTDDATLPPNLETLYQYGTCKMTRGSSIHTRVIKPCVNVVVDGPTAGAMIKRSPWLDLGNSNVPHYGLKYGIPQLPSGANPLDYDLEITSYVAFRGVR